MKIFQYVAKSYQRYNITLALIRVIYSNMLLYSISTHNYYQYVICPVDPLAYILDKETHNIYLVPGIKYARTAYHTI